MSKLLWEKLFADSHSDELEKYWKRKILVRSTYLISQSIATQDKEF